MRHFKQIRGSIGTIVMMLLFFLPIQTVTAGFKEELAIIKGLGQIDQLPNTIEGLRQWYLKDQAYLRSTSNTDHQKEIRELQTKMESIESRPDYQDPSGFKIYQPITTGRIHLLSAAITARMNPGGKYPYDELLGHKLHDENPEQYPDLNRVIRLLHAIHMPQRAFEGFKVYLLPYSMGDANGYGGNGYAFLAASPAGEALIPNQLEVTLAHELGHHLHFRFMDRSTVQGQKLWGTYLKIRGISWKSGGEAGSKAWTFSSEEVFAEDFRVWEGGAAVGSGYFGDLSYPNPTKKKGEGLKRFFETLPSNPMAKEENPWSDQDSTGTVSLWVVLPYMAIAFLGLPFVYQMKRKSGH